MTDRMRAFTAPEYGPVETQRIETVPRPALGPKDILVRVLATTVNRSDTEMRKCTYQFARLFFGLTRPKCKITGCEFAGVVEQTGPEVSRFKVGDRVFGFDGDDYQAHADYVVKNEDKPIALMPDGFGFEECVALGEGPGYAMNYIRHLSVGANTRLAVNGATGAIGSAFTQLAAQRGATILATARAEHHDLVTSWGASEVIDYTRTDFTQHSYQFDVIMDAVGKSSFSKAKRVLKPGGLYASSELGPCAENVWKALLGKVMGGKRPIFPIPKIDSALLASFATMLEQGTLRPHIDKTFPFDEIREASHYVESAQKVGAVVITM